CSGGCFLSVPSAETPPRSPNGGGFFLSTLARASVGKRGTKNPPAAERGSENRLGALDLCNSKFPPRRRRGGLSRLSQLVPADAHSNRRPPSLVTPFWSHSALGTAAR